MAGTIELALTRQFIQGKNNVLADSLSLPNLSPFRDPSAIGTDALLRNWDGYQVYAFPPWSMIPLVLKKF